MRKVTEAIIEHWGKRCPDHHEDCAACQAWGEHDRLESIEEAVRDYYLPKIKNIFTRLHGGTDAMRDEGHKLWLIYNDLKQLTGSELTHE
jgi:hypothetical protein